MNTYKITWIRESVPAPDGFFFVKTSIVKADWFMITSGGVATFRRGGETVYTASPHAFANIELVEDES